MTSTTVSGSRSITLISVITFAAGDNPSDTTCGNGNQLDPLACFATHTSHFDIIRIMPGLLAEMMSPDENVHVLLYESQATGGPGDASVIRELPLHKITFEGAAASQQANSFSHQRCLQFDQNLMTLVPH